MHEHDIKISMEVQHNQRAYQEHVTICPDEQGILTSMNITTRTLLIA